MKKRNCKIIFRLSNYMFDIRQEKILVVKSSIVKRGKIEIIDSLKSVLNPDFYS